MLCCLIQKVKLFSRATQQTDKILKRTSKPFSRVKRSSEKVVNSRVPKLKEQEHQQRETLPLKVMTKRPRRADLTQLIATLSFKNSKIKSDLSSRPA